jgi:hypothetical protein
MGTLAKVVLAPLIALGAIILTLIFGIMVSDGFGVDGILLPAAIVGGGLFVLYLRRKRNGQTDSAPVRQHSSFIEQSPRLSGEHVFEGHGGTVVIHEHVLAIHRHGIGSFLTQGMKGEKRIPFKNITAVQFKPAGSQMAGYIQFSIVGGIESGAGIFDATLDENTVMFTPAQSARFTELRDLVEARFQSTPQAQVRPTNSLADEIAKLAELRDKHILTEEEFASQKIRLLRG